MLSLAPLRGTAAPSRSAFLLGMGSAVTGHFVDVTAWERPTVSVAVFVLVLGAMVWAWRRGWLWWFVASFSVLCSAAWFGAKEIVRRDWRDADGYVDCWPRCSAVQDGVAVALWWVPVGLVVLVAISGVLAAITVRRGVHGQRA
jgi:hypothetical protein